MTHKNSGGEPCCPKFDPGPWDGTTREWKGKTFLMRTTPQFLHMPLLPLYRKTLAGMWKIAKENGAAPPLEDFLLLATDPSPWKSELYMATVKEVPGEKNVTLSGTFFSRVFDGPYNAVPKWIKEINLRVAERGRKVKRYFVYYTTCPRCAKIYGHNYAVVLAELD